MDQAAAAAAGGAGQPAAPTALDLGQLSQWMAEQQVRLLRDLTAQQQESQATLLCGLAQTLGAGPAASVLGPVRGAPFQLTKLGEADEIDAYLEAFERTAEAAQWPRDQWAFIIGPYLTGEAQAALRALPKEESADYRVLKAAILDRYEVTPDSYRQKFRSITYKKVEQPRALINALRDAAYRWLKPALEGEKKIVDQVVLEQLLNILPPKARQWVACSHPASLKEATALLENFAAAADPREAPRDTGPGTRTSGPSPRPLENPRPGRARSGAREASGPRPGASRAPPLLPGREGAWGRPLAGPGPEAAPKSSRDPEDRGPCFKCGQRGHFIRDCPLMECDAGWEEAYPVTARPPRPPPLIVMVEVAGRRLSAFLDSGSSISMIKCYHTLAYISASDELLSFGRGCSEHGTASLKLDEMQNFNISALISPNELSGIQVKQIFAGTYVNFASSVQPQASKYTTGPSSVETLPKISQMDRALIDKWMSATAESETRQKAKREIEVIFSSPACLTASFLKPRFALETGCCIAVDLQKAREVFCELTKKDWITGRVSFSLVNHLISSLPLNSPHQEALSCCLLLPECFAALEAQNFQSLALPFAKAINGMSKRSSDILEKYWSSLPATFFDNIVQVLKKAVVSQLPFYLIRPHCQELIPILEVLQDLYKVNKKAGCKLQLSNFYIDDLSQKINLFVDLARWHTWIDNLNPSPLISFCRFPFVFNPISKMQLFDLDSATLQECIKAEAHQILVNNHLNKIDEYPKLPVFPLRVRRHNLVEDTLHKLSQAEDISLKMQLLIQFEGEVGRPEAGGILVEFFLYVFEEMVHPDYGMFMYCEKNSPMWFPARPSAEMKKYYLFGILYGLCLYNRVTAHVPLPLAAFKKLMGKKPSLDDLKELSPVLGKSLQAVLDCDHDDTVADLQLCYNIHWDNMDMDLIPDGSSVAVNIANRKDFVSRYVDYIFNRSVEGVFEEFKRGFYKVLDKRVIGFFEPQELMEVAIGNANYDWDVYEKNAVYWGIYNPTHPTITKFWKVFHELTLADKKGFLLFVTGSDRVPITGMESMKLTIHSHKALSEEHIPEAQTCYHILLLPPYSATGKLKEKLLRAIENNSGFGKY